MESSNKIEKSESRLPVVAIIGRPNVGKSTLFNRLAKRRKAMVLKMPGVTRDRNYQQIEWSGDRMLLIDTGGYDPGDNDTLFSLVREQTQMAIDEADVILFITEVSHTLHPHDEKIMQMLRMIRKPVFVVVNKCDNPQREQTAYEFLKLGIETVYPISAEHNLNITGLMDDVVEALPDTSEEESYSESIRVAIIGKPNVGKSTLLNSILGEKRVIVSAEPGTTRDSVDTLITRNDKHYTFIDTAGLKRRGKHKQIIDKISVSASIMSLQRCDIALVVCDATEGITKQDQHVAGYAIEAGKGIVIVVNKWDLVGKDRDNLSLWQEQVEYMFKFAKFAPAIYVSGLTGKRVNNIFSLIDIIYKEYCKRIQTSELNQAISEIVQHRTPATYKGRQVKIKYATQVAIKPPSFALFTNFPQSIHFSYTRYMENQLRQRFGFAGTPIRLFWRQSEKK